MLGILRTVLFAPRGPRAGPRRSRRAPRLVPRRPARRPVPPLRHRRADYDRVLRQRARPAKSRPRGRAATCAPSTSGTATSPPTARRCSRSRSSLVAALAPPASRGVRRSRAGQGAAIPIRRSLVSRCWRRTTHPTRSGSWRRPLLEAMVARCGGQGGGARREPRRSAPRRPGAAARRGPQGVRQPRRVVVVRVGAAAGRPTSCSRTATRATTGGAAVTVRPALILDDVFAELDARRRDRLAEWLPRGRSSSPRPSP